MEPVQRVVVTGARTDLLDAAPRSEARGPGAAAPPPATISVEGLSKRYGRGRDSVQALDDVSFEVGAGEAVALLGHNGAGKSTLIRMIATLLKPDAGRVVVGGHELATEAAKARRLLGVALQDTGVPRRQTARRLLETHGRLHGLGARPARARAGELIETFGLDGVAGREVATYSGGERRRLDLAVALVHQPRVVLLDEPAAGLDLASRRSIWQQLDAQLRAGTTLLFSTHDLHEADRQAHRIAIVDHGRLLAYASSDELRRRFSSGLPDDPDCAESPLAAIFDRITGATASDGDRDEEGSYE